MRRMPRWSLLLLVLSVLAFAGAAWGLSTLTLTGPGEGVNNIGTTVNFTWTLVPDGDVTSSDQVSYDLYLSKLLSDLESHPVSTGMVEDGYNVDYPYAGSLDEGSLYFWKVVAHTPSGDVSSTSFFSTESEVGALTLLTPSSGQTGVAPQDVEFSWSFDSGDGSLTSSDVSFDLYLSDKYETIFDNPPIATGIQALDVDVEGGVFEVTRTRSVGYGTHYWTVVVHAPGGEMTTSPRAFTTLSEASDPNLTGGCSAAPIGGLAAMALLAGLALVKRRN